MNFADLIYYLYLLLAIALLIGLWRWMVGLIGRLDKLQPEQRTLLFLLVMLAAVVISLVLAAKLNLWRKSPSANSPAPALQTASAPQQPTAPQQPLTEEQKLAQFEEKHFPQLHAQRLALYDGLQHLSLFAQKIQALQAQHPKQQDLLIGIERISRDSYVRLYNRYLTVSQEIRNFWVSYNTGNADHAVQKFTPQAQRLTEAIKDTLGDQIDDERAAEKLIEAHLLRADKRLKNNTLPEKTAGITSYSVINRTQVISDMETQLSQEMLINLDKLAEDRLTIQQRIGQLQGYIQRYPDLQNHLEQTLQRWQQALQHNLYADYRLIYAIEIEDVLQKLAIETASKGRKTLAKDLNTYLPRIVNAVQEQMVKAEESYSPLQVLKK